MKDGASLPYWPRMLRRELAAAYVGLSPTLFDTEAKAGRLPAPVALAGTVKAWDRADLDAWIADRKGAEEAVPDTWDGDAA